MRHGVTTTVLALCGWLAVAGCPSSEKPSADASETASEPAPPHPTGSAPGPHKGFLEIGGRHVPIGPFVARDAKSDLRVLCKLMVDEDEEKKADEVRPLCYGERWSPALRLLRIEYVPDGTVSSFTRRLATSSDGAHVLIEQTGSIWQVLDLGLPPRRAGELRPGEIRVLSANRKAHETLMDALTGIFPKLKVEIVQFAE